MDRLVIKHDLPARLDGLPGAGLKAGRGPGAGGLVAGRRGTALLRELRLRHCGVSLPELNPQLFSFNSPQGACPACSGLGTRLILDPDLVVPNPELSLREGAVRPWAQRHSLRHQQMLEALEKHYHFSVHTPFQDLPKEAQKAILYGSKGEPIKFYPGARRPPLL